MPAEQEEAIRLEEGAARMPHTPRTKFFLQMKKGYGAIPAWRDSFADSNHSVSSPADFFIRSQRIIVQRVSGSFKGAVRSLSEAASRRCSIIEHKGTATIKNEVVNLVNNIVGSGIVALPSGIAAFGNSPSALIPALVLVWLVALLNAYYFSLIGRLCAITGALSYRDIWEKSIGQRGAGAIATVCMIKAGLAVWCLSVILADSSHSLFLTIGVTVFTRTQVLIMATVVTLLPLCLVKNLSFLAPFSLVGVSAVVFTAIVMWKRFFDGTYELPEGRYIADLDDDLKPDFGPIGWEGAFSIRSLTLVCMLSTAYVAHYNAPRFYIELKDNTIERYNTVVGTSFGFCSLLCSFFAAAGFLTFGGSCSGYILNNYSNTDILAAICRVAISLSVIFTYPVLFVGMRDGLIDMIGLALEDQTAGTLNLISVSALSAVTAFAAVWRDLAFVVSLGGATLATAIIFIFPAIMFRAAVKNMGDRATDELRLEAKICLMVMWLGIIMGILGVWMAFNPMENDIKHT